MKTYLFSSLALALACSTVSASSLSVEEVVSGDNTIYTLSFLPEGDSGTFDTLTFDVTADSPFVNPAQSVFAVLNSDDSLTGLNERLVASAFTPGGIGATPFGPTVSPDRVFATLSILGTNDISTFDPLLLAQVTLPTDAIGNVDILAEAGGQQVARFSVPLGGTVEIPEPASLALVGLGIAGVVARRRRI